MDELWEYLIYDKVDVRWFLLRNFIVDKYLKYRYVSSKFCNDEFCWDTKFQDYSSRSHQPKPVVGV